MEEHCRQWNSICEGFGLWTSRNSREAGWLEYRKDKRVISFCLFHCQSQGLYLLIFQFSSVAQLNPTLCDPMDCRILGFPVHHQLLEVAQTYVHQVGDAVQPSYPLLSPSPAFCLSQHQGLFFNESVLHIMQPKYWNLSFSISPSNEYSGLFSFRIDLFDLLAVQGTLRSLLQHHSSKASAPWHSAFLWSNSHIHT